MGRKRKERKEGRKGGRRKGKEGRKEGKKERKKEEERKKGRKKEKGLLPHVYERPGAALASGTVGSRENNVTRIHLSSLPKGDVG